jgi:hypothetical protein
MRPLSQIFDLQREAGNQLRAVSRLLKRTDEKNDNPIIAAPIKPVTSSGT